jgi:glycosyltransferase involved in cell wall biosynthesis
MSEMSAMSERSRMSEVAEEPVSRAEQVGQLQPPLISIVLPVYNGARFLPESLASVVAQTYPNWELICVDDTSTDATPAVLAEWAAREPRIRVIRHEVNKRLPGALNTGFAAARGDLLTWTSDDNHYRPHALETLAQRLRSTPALDFVYSDYALMDEDGAITGVSVAPAPQGLITGKEGLPSFLYRRRVYERVGDYAADLFLAEDYDYWLRVIAAGFALEPLHETLYEYRRHARSLTDEYRGRTFEAAEKALLRNMAGLIRRYPRLRGAIYLQLASLASWRGQRGRAGYYALLSVRYSPREMAMKTRAYVERRLNGSGAPARR